VLATLDLLITLMAEPHSPSELLGLLNLECQAHRLPRVSSRSLSRYRDRVFTLWAERTDRTRGEFDQMVTNLRAKAAAIAEDPDENPLVRSTAIKEERELLVVQAQLHGFLGKNGPSVSVNIANVQPVQIREGADTPALRAALAIMRGENFDGG
jgi:hypothetical protein